MATAQDAGLILKLYELRTEATMRESRQILGGFNPTSFAEIAALQTNATSRENAAWRQVISYWEMAAALVLHGAVDADLFNDVNGENLFIYSKFTPFLEEYAKATGQPFMPKTAKLLEKYPAMQERYAMMLARMNARKKQAGA
jgi:hypothetical protein